MQNVSALLITGGYTGGPPRYGQWYTSAEVWAPGVEGADPLHCNLPNMKFPRFHHTLTTRGGAAPLMCGGGNGENKKTCEQYNSTSNSWQDMSARLVVERYGHSAWWDDTTGITYQMGGRKVETSVSTISTSGNVSTIGRPFWTMKNKTL